MALLFTWPACQHAPRPETVEPGLGETSGTVRLRSTPSGARLFLDGGPTQLRTPTIISPLSQGEHRLRLSLPGYREWQKTILIKAGETRKIDILLEPKATGALKVSSVPFQCRIFIDGRPTLHVTPATLEDLPVGTHTIRLQKDGYDDWSHAFVVLENRQLELAASLKPSKEVTGHLRIQSSPPQAQIFLDGYPTGNRTPAILYNLQAGSHHIRLALDGHQDYKEDILIREEMVKNLLVTLRRQERMHLGSATIETIPGKAEVYLDGVRLRERTPVHIDALERGTHALRLEKEGYQPWEGELKVRPGGEAHHSIVLLPFEEGEQEPRH